MLKKNEHGFIQKFYPNIGYGNWNCQERQEDVAMATHNEMICIEQWEVLRTWDKHNDILFFLNRALKNSTDS